jgi:L-iditol 2-dehydrogenase
VPGSDKSRIPETVSFDQAALIEPLSVSIHGVNRSQVPIHGKTLIFGAGAIGLLTAAVLRAQDMSEVMVADIDSARLTIAKDLGLATKTFLIPLEPKKTEIGEILKDAQDLAAKIAESAGIRGFDRVYECSGVPSCVQTGIYATKPGGKLVLIGMGQAIQTLPLGAAALREVDIIGVFRYANTYPTAIKLITSGKLPRIHELVTHKRSLENAEEAFILAKDGRDKEGKPVLKVVIEA